MKAIEITNPFEIKIIDKEKPVPKENDAEMLISNMDYAGVNGAVITQEEIDGNQNEYLLSAKTQFPNRLKICSLYEENKPYTLDSFDGIKICAGRLPTQDLQSIIPCLNRLIRTTSLYLSTLQTVICRLHHFVKLSSSYLI